MNTFAPASPPAAPPGNPVGSSAAGAAPRPTLTPDQFKRFCDFIYQIAGIRFSESKSYFLASKLENRRLALGLSSIEDYYQYLQRPASRNSEYPLLMDEVTINETFFFRNQPQLEAFAEQVLTPLLVTRRAQGRMTIRIWSAACSTGDELYTLVLQILNMDRAKDFKFEFIGTDICRDAVEKARAAVYKKYAVRNIPENMMVQHFTTDETNGTYTLKPETRAYAKFGECNLMEGGKIHSLGKFDIVFLRNVLIYFDDRSKEQVLMNIANVMNDDGYLIVGHSENLYSQRHIFASCPDKSAAIAYQKAPPGTPKRL